jgi:hypothetical protein
MCIEISTACFCCTEVKILFCNSNIINIGIRRVQGTRWIRDLQILMAVLKSKIFCTRSQKKLYVSSTVAFHILILLLPGKGKSSIIRPRRAFFTIGTARREEKELL